MTKMTRGVPSCVVAGCSWLWSGSETGNLPGLWVPFGVPVLELDRRHTPVAARVCTELCLFQKYSFCHKLTSQAFVFITCYVFGTRHTRTVAAWDWVCCSIACAQNSTAAPWAHCPSTQHGTWRIFWRCKWWGWRTHTLVGVAARRTYTACEFWVPWPPLRLFIMTCHFFTHFGLSN